MRKKQHYLANKDSQYFIDVKGQDVIEFQPKAVIINIGRAIGGIFPAMKGYQLMEKIVTIAIK